MVGALACDRTKNMVNLARQAAASTVLLNHPTGWRDYPLGGPWHWGTSGQRRTGAEKTWQEGNERFIRRGAQPVPRAFPLSVPGGEPVHILGRGRPSCVREKHPFPWILSREDRPIPPG